MQRVIFFKGGAPCLKPTPAEICLPLISGRPLFWLDALYLKVRQNHRVVSQLLVIAMGI